MTDNGATLRSYHIDNEFYNSFMKILEAVIDQCTFYQTLVTKEVKS